MSRRISIVLIALLLTGCSQSQPEVSNGTALEVAAPSISPAIRSNLELADQLDGSKDQIIGKCYVCALGMNGKPDFKVELDGYTAHLCSEHCRDHFAANWQSVVAETDIPAVDAP